MRGLSLAAASGDHSSSRCAGLSLSLPLLLRSTGSRRAGSVVVAHGPSCSAACGIFPDQGSNPCPLNWQADSQPLRHQGSPKFFFKNARRLALLQMGGKKKIREGLVNRLAWGLAQLVKDTAETPPFDSYPSILSTSSQLSSSVFNIFLLKMFLEVCLQMILKCQRTFWYSG